VRGGEVNVTKLAATSISDLLELAEQAAEVTSAASLEQERTSFAHTASLELGGGPSPCVEIGCRIGHADQLARYAALYGDRIYTNCFFADHVAHADSAMRANPETVRSRMKDDLAVLLHLRPLIEAGRVIPVTPPRNHCPHCLSIHTTFDEDTLRRLNAVTDHVARRHLREVEVIVERIGPRYFVRLKGPEDLLEHGGGGIIFDQIPDGLRSDPRLVARIHHGGPIKLTRSQRLALGTHKREAEKIRQNLVFELSVCQCLGTSLLTSNQLDVDLLTAISQDAVIAKRNALIQRHLTAIVPFLEELDVRDLLELRTKEADSFILFRGALSKAISDTSANGADFTEERARQIYGDVLAPQLAGLDLKMAGARRAFRKTTGRRIVGWVGAISFGAFTGILPAGLVAAAQALGLTKVLADSTEAAMTLSDAEESIRSDEMYFLWRLRKLAKR